MKAGLDRCGLLKEKLEEKVGQKLLYTAEILRILERLGRKAKTRTTIRDISQDKIYPKKYGLNPRKFSLSDNIALYTHNYVLNYLRKLEDKGKIRNLHGATIEDLLELGYHEPFVVDANKETIIYTY